MESLLLISNFLFVIHAFFFLFFFSAVIYYCHHMPELSNVKKMLSQDSLTQDIFQSGLTIKMKTHK